MTCRHLMMVDWEENRVLRCGHPGGLILDSNEAAPVIVYVEFQSPFTTIVTPDWCPLRPDDTVVQRELFK